MPSSYTPHGEKDGESKMFTYGGWQLFRLKGYENEYESDRREWGSIDQLQAAKALSCYTNDEERDEAAKARDELQYERPLKLLERRLTECSLPIAGRLGALRLAGRSRSLTNGDARNGAGGRSATVGEELHAEWTRRRMAEREAMVEASETGCRLSLTEILERAREEKKVEEFKAGWTEHQPVSNVDWQREEDCYVERDDSDASGDLFTEAREVEDVDLMLWCDELMTDWEEKEDRRMKMERELIVISDTDEDQDESTDTDEAWQELERERRRLEEAMRDVDRRRNVLTRRRLRRSVEEKRREKKRMEEMKMRETERKRMKKLKRRTLLRMTR